MKVVLILLGLLCGDLRAADAITISYPAPEVAGDARYQYYWSLLGAALEATRLDWGDFRLQEYPTAMSFERVLAEVAGGNGRVNILVRATNRELEGRLLPVALPLDKGLLGYRIFLTRRDVLPGLEKVRSAQDLKAFSFGQGRNWSDVPVLVANGFRVETGSDYQALFRMLAGRRFDLFPRGVIEIAGEWSREQARQPEIVIERRLLLHYPMPRYFFVPRTKEGQKLARRIDEGLKRLVANGEFERRYQAYKREVLRGVALAGRRVIEIPNPGLSALAPPKGSPWWDDLSEELGGGRSAPR